MKKKTLQRIVVVRTDRIGDVILTLPVVTALKRRYPKSIIDMLLAPSTCELVEDHPNVHEIIIDDEETIHAGIRGFFRLRRLIRKRKYDLAIVVHPTFRLALLLFLARVPKRIGTGYRWYQFLFNEKIYEHRHTALRHEVEYNLNLLRPLGIHCDSVTFDIHVPSPVIAKMEEVVHRHGGTTDDRIVLLHPGSKGTARDWPWYKFSELGEKLMTTMNGSVVLTGSEDEVDLVAEVSRRMNPKPIMVICEVNLKELTAFIRHAHLLVINSTGPLLIAAAVGTPVLALFPPIIPCRPRR